MSAHLPEEASSCALSLYQQDRAREQTQFQNQQGDINQIRRREGLEIPNGEAVESDGAEGSSEQSEGDEDRADTWDDRAVEWF